MSYAEDVGSRLRRVRLQQGLSLQDVERQSEGEWKAAVVGSYERGDRNISASRLIELAEFYGVSPADILPAEDGRRPVERSAGIVVDLAKLGDAGPRFDGVRRWLRSANSGGLSVERVDKVCGFFSRGDDGFATTTATCRVIFIFSLRRWRCRGRGHLAHRRLRRLQLRPVEAGDPGEHRDLG